MQILLSKIRSKYLIDGVMRPFGDAVLDGYMLRSIYSHLKL